MESAAPSSNTASAGMREADLLLVAEDAGGHRVLVDARLVDAERDLDLVLERAAHLEREAHRARAGRGCGHRHGDARVAPAPRW